MVIHIKKISFVIYQKSATHYSLLRRMLDTFYRMNLQMLLGLIPILTYRQDKNYSAYHVKSLTKVIDKEYDCFQDLQQ
ncbi:MAG: hypothetical protein CMF74_18810 [Maricaulis sp.]|nr:hypothetical protein [Maricaulis sp.]